MSRIKINDLSFCEAQPNEANRVQGGSPVIRQFFRSYGIGNLQSGSFYDPTTGTLIDRNVTIRDQVGSFAEVALMPSGIKRSISASMASS